MFDLVREWYTDTFRHTEMFYHMSATVEGSPWHREANVGVHTDMVVGEFIKSASTASYSDRLKALGILATAFHDVGKPSSRTEKYREDRGHYVAFHGHEKVSSVMFLEYALSRQLPVVLEDREIYLVTWMIENHMPWDVTHPTKLQALRQTAESFGALDLYCDALLADQRGRIADDQEAKNARANEWIEQFRFGADVVHKVNGGGANVAYILIGPSGAGKSTFVKKLTQEDPQRSVFSLDQLRHEWYDRDDYANAWVMSTKDSKFSSKASAVASKMFRTGGDIIVDNTNMTRKARSQFVSLANQNRYRVVGVWFPTPLELLISRQTTRGDKSVPIDAVERQFRSLELPTIGPAGEVDEVLIL
jgi:predicted kinase